MDRLQQKCFLASALLHGALLIGVVLLSAFTPTPPEPPQTVMTYVSVPSNLLNPPSAPPAAETTPAPPADATPPPPPPPPPKVEVVTPPKTEVKPAPPEKHDVTPKKLELPKPDGLLAPKKETKSKPKTEDKKAETKKPDPKKTEKTAAKKEDTTEKNKKTIKLADTEHLSTRTPKHPSGETDEHSKEAEAEGKKRAEQYDKARKDWQKQISGAFSGLRSNISGPVNFTISGPGAAAFQNYGQQIVSLYERSWLVPSDVADNNAVVQITVTIRRDGRVVDARVIRASGSAPVDRSVRDTLQRVRQFPPFPEGSDDEQRTFNVDFNLKAKRSLG